MSTRRGPRRGFVVLWLLAVALSGCGRLDGPVSNAGVRIVSLSPAVTQIIHELGFAAAIVAVGAHDPVAPPGAKVVGDLYQLDYEKLLRVRPTHVFLQPGRGGVPAVLADFAGTHGWKVHSYAIETIDDAMRALDDPLAPESSRSVGEALGVRKLAAAVKLRVRRQLSGLARLFQGAARPRVVLLVGLEPLTAAGPGTFLDEILTVAGGRNVLALSANGYPVLDKERMVMLAPEAIVHVRSTSANLDAEDAELAVAVAGLDVHAVRAGRVHALTEAAALLPSTSMPRVAARLAVILHPELALEVERVLAEPSPP